MAVDLDGKEEFVVIRWFEGELYKGQTIFRIDNVAQREHTIKDGNGKIIPYLEDMQLIEMDYALKAQVDNDNNKDYQVPHSKNMRTNNVDQYISDKDPNNGQIHYHGVYKTTIPTLQQDDVSRLRNDDLVTGKSGLIRNTNQKYLYFEYDKAQLLHNEENAAIINQVIAALTQDPDLKVLIHGYAIPENGTGDPQHNENLATERAHAAAEFIKDIAHKAGIDVNRIIDAIGDGIHDAFKNGVGDGTGERNRCVRLDFAYKKSQ